MAMMFAEWLESNKDLIAEKIKTDVEEALFMVWAAGYDAGADQVAQYARNFLNPLP